MPIRDFVEEFYARHLLWLLGTVDVLDPARILVNLVCFALARRSVEYDERYTASMVSGTCTFGSFLHRSTRLTLWRPLIGQVQNHMEICIVQSSVKDRWSTGAESERENATIRTRAERGCDFVCNNVISIYTYSCIALGGTTSTLSKCTLSHSLSRISCLEILRGLETLALSIALESCAYSRS